MKKNTNFKNKCVVLSMALMLAFSLVACGGKEENTTTAATESTTTTEATTEAATDATEQTTAAEQSGNGYYVDVKVSNQWESGDGLIGAQCDLIFYNQTDATLTDWKIEIAVPDNFRTDSAWNGTYELKNNVLTITSVDYNKEIAANSNIPIGFIMYASDVIKPEMVTISVGGEVVKNDASTEQPTEATEATEEVTTEAVEEAPAVADGETPFGTYGKLSVKGTNLVDKNGKAVQLRGISTHGLAWFPQYVNKDAFKDLRDKWNVNMIRLAMYTAENGGYCTDGNKDNLKKLIDQAVKDTESLGMYVTIDWHILHDLNPKVHQGEAEKFFEEMSKKYADKDHVIYEICNEPNGGTSWSDVKAYAEDIIPIIRKNDKDAIIIVGTPNWSQDVDVASKDPIKGHDNIMYAVHFYAATHKDDIRNKVKTAIAAGLPIFISEFSICDASGNGAIDYDSANTWMELAKEYNLSFCGWSLCNKAETSAMFKSSCSKTSGFTEEDLSESGKWLLDTIKNK